MAFGMGGKRPLFGRCHSPPAEPDPRQSLHGRHHPRGQLPAPQLGISALEACGISPANTGDTGRPRATRFTRPGSNGDVRRPEPTYGTDRWPALAPSGCDAEAEDLCMGGAKDFSLGWHAVAIARV